RAVIEEMGGKIDSWDPVAKCATLSYNGNIIKLWINKDKAEVNGVLKEIDPGKGVVPELVNNRTLLPIRFILKELGLPELQWDGNLQTITLQY
ncbi:MAG: copper amine oxidase N-terminal domain-containing protein, partial [Vallitaleaceae bacterium]|nr:copper amine oxidase N-terminal domain-containing protein [Vallitaleaceae bacterium]